MISLDYRDSRPLYQQVKDNLRRMMLTGLLPPDEKLPSVRSLATQLAINPNTIQRAYSELEVEGYIYSVSGKGSFAAAEGGEQQRRIRELKTQAAPLLEELKTLGCTEAISKDILVSKRHRKSLRVHFRRRFRHKAMPSRPLFHL